MEIRRTAKEMEARKIFPKSHLWVQPLLFSLRRPKEVSMRVEFYTWQNFLKISSSEVSKVIESGLMLPNEPRGIKDDLWSMYSDPIQDFSFWTNLNGKNYYLPQPPDYLPPGGEISDPLPTPPLFYLPPKSKYYLPPLPTPIGVGKG